MGNAESCISCFMEDIAFYGVENNSLDHSQPFSGAHLFHDDDIGFEVFQFHKENDQWKLGL